MRKYLIYVCLFLLCLLSAFGTGQLTGAEYGELSVDAYTTALWLFNETSGGTAYDETSNNHDGSVTGADIVTGYFGNARSFGAVSTDIITVSDHADFTMDVATDYTWDGWFYIDQVADTAQFLYLILSGDFLSGVSMSVNNNEILQVAWANSADVDDLTQVGQTILSTTTWYYVAMTYDASASQADRFTLYLNGMDDSGTPSSNGTISDINPAYIYLGNLLETFRLYGVIDSFRLRSGYLATPDEIRAIYAMQKGAFGIIE